MRYQLGSLCIAPLIAALASYAMAQGSAAGYGQGGLGGGGFGGGLGGPFGNESRRKEPSRPDDDATNGLWTQKSAILTPGDRVEYKLKVKQGETLLASATSEAFDVALSLEDSLGKTLAKNDDRVEGDQSPFVSYRFAKAGDYTLKVLSYRSTSGGKFALKMRTFVATDMAEGVAEHRDVVLVPLESENRVVFRLIGQKGKIYDLRSVTERLNQNARYGGSYTLNFIGIIGPTGFPMSDFTMVGTPDTTPVVQVLLDGDYYVEYGSYRSSRTSPEPTFRTDVREVRTVAAKPSDELAIPLGPDELKFVEFPVQPNLIVRTTLAGSVVDVLVSGPEGTDIPGTESPNSGGDIPYGNTPAYAWFKSNIDSDLDVTRVFHGAGNARIALRSRNKAPATLRFRNAESLPTWSDGPPLKSSLEVGDSRLVLLKSSKSELMRVSAQASHFLPRLDIFRLSGEIANTLCNRKTHIAGDDLYFPSEGTFVVRLSCEGNGGSGDFEMKRESLKPLPYRLGTDQAFELNGKNFGLYSVDLEANKRYQLLLDQPEMSIRADLLDEDGGFLTSQELVFDQASVRYFVPTRSGRHRLWLRGGPGIRHFRLELHRPPRFGDGGRG